MWINRWHSMWWPSNGSWWEYFDICKLLECIVLDGICFASYFHGLLISVLNAVHSYLPLPWSLLKFLHFHHRTLPHCCPPVRAEKSVRFIDWCGCILYSVDAVKIQFFLSSTNRTHSPGWMALFVHTIHSHISSCHRNFSRCVFMRRSSARFASRAQGDAIAFDYCWFHQHKTSRIQMLVTFILHAQIFSCLRFPPFLPVFFLLMLLSLFRAIQCHLLSRNIFIAPFQCIFIRFCTFRATKFNGNTLGI